MNTEPSRNLPSKPGMYWARSTSGHTWYDLIVVVGGESPWLKIEEAFSRGTRAIPKNPDNCYFGPEITEPFPEKSEVTA